MAQSSVGRRISGRRSTRVGRPRRIFAPLSPAVAILICFLTAFACSVAPVANAQGIPAQAKQVQAKPAEESAQSLEERSALNQVLFRNRQLKLSLAFAAQQFQSGRAAEGVSALQRILDQPEDAFVWNESEPRPVSARKVGAQLLESAAPAVLQLYEQIHGGEAHRLLELARQTQDPTDFARLTRRFFYTAAGFEGMDWQGAWHLDHGSYSLAAQCWDRLLESPIHRKRVTPVLKLKAAFAHSRLQESRRAAEIIAQTGDIPVKLASRSVTPRALLRTAGGNLPGAENPEDWRMFLGTPDRNARSEGSTPLLKPIWNFPLFSEDIYTIVNQQIRAWQDRQYREGLPMSVANYPLVINDKVIFRSTEGIRALQLRTGKTDWSYPCETSIATALPLFQQLGSRNSDPVELVNRLLVGNSVFGMLSSDGERIYAIDELEYTLDLKGGAPEPEENAALPRGTRRSRLRSPRDTNRLIALPVDFPKAAERPNGPAPQPVWSLGGAVEGDRHAAAASLAGHFFLGPPVPVDGLLFAVTEADRQLNVVALKADTGEVVWTQGIALVLLPIDQDLLRHNVAATPSYSEGVLVCPTQLGILVAIDSLSGGLLWVYHYLDGEGERKIGEPDRRFSNVNQLPGQSHSGFPNVPQIHGDSIVYLPRLSENIHCLDLHRGESRWKVARADAEYIATIDNDIVLVVGRRACRGLSLRTGKQEWSVHLGMPSGRGVRIGSRYLIPLADGIVANLDIATGSQLGYTNPERNIRPGNLVAYQDVLLSLGSSELTAFPQAQSYLEKVLANVGNEYSSAERNLLAGELQLRLGHLSAAKSSLTKALQSSLSTDRRLAAADLMRELLYIELEDPANTEVAEQLLDALADLSRTPEQRGQYLMQRAESQLRRRNLDAVVSSVQEYALLGLSIPLPLLNDKARLLAPAAWSPEILDRVRRQAGPGELARIQTMVDQELELAIQTGPEHSLQGFLSAFGRWPQADKARWELARLLASQGRHQPAEVLLLENRGSENVEVAAETCRQLAELWEKLGLYQEAGGMLAELANRYADVRLGDGRTGQVYVATYQRDLLSWSAYRRLIPLDWPVTRVRITEQREPNEKLKETYSGYRRKLTPTAGGSFELLDKGDSEAGRLVQIDRETGIKLAEIDVPTTYMPSLNPQDALVGHLVPLANPMALMGVSLLDRDICWSTVPKGMGKHPEVIRVGPSGTDFCTFQTRQSLYLLNPGNGQVLWQRNDLEPNQGLFNDGNTGIFGDRQTLVLFGADRKTYTVFSTLTGAEIRRGKLNSDKDYNRLAFGRMLLYVTEGPSPTLRLWDPQTDRVLLEEPFTGRPYYYIPVRFSPEFVLILPTGRIRMIEGRTGAVHLDVQLPPEKIQNINAVQAFTDGARYYINIQRAGIGNVSASYRFNVSDSFLPGVPVQGELYAVERGTNKILWEQLVPLQTVVHVPEYQLPFLMCLSRVRNRGQFGNTQSLQLDILDCKTGEMLGTKSNLLTDRILQLQYERDEGVIEIRGAMMQARLEFGRRQASLDRDAESP